MKPNHAIVAERRTLREQFESWSLGGPEKWYVLLDKLSALEAAPSESAPNIKAALKILSDPDIDKPKCKVCGSLLKVQNSEHWGMACVKHWDGTRMDFGNSERAKDWAFRIAIWKAIKALEQKGAE